MKINDWIKRLFGAMRLSHEQEYSQLIHDSIDTNITRTIPMIHFTAKKELLRSEELKIERWLEEKLKSDQVILTFRRR